jgi:hypothetical protein
MGADVRIIGTAVIRLDTALLPMRMTGLVKLCPEEQTDVNGHIVEMKKTRPSGESRVHTPLLGACARSALAMYAREGG